MEIPRLTTPRFTTLFLGLMLLQACDGGSTSNGSMGSNGVAGSAGTSNDAGAPDAFPIDDVTDGTEAQPAPIAGDIAHFGVISLGDERGEASDLVARFAAVASPVAPEAFGAALQSDQVGCQVELDDGVVELSDLSVVYVPQPDNVALDTIGAGDTLTLSSATGSWTELQPRAADGTYALAPGAMLPTGPVPDELTIDISGQAFPAFAGVALPPVETLAAVDYEGGGRIGIDTRFSWTPGTADNARIRILTETAGGFFLDQSTQVDCLVPDTGEFTFPADVRAALGSGFDGAAPMFSRVAISTSQQGDALLVLVRESLVP